MSITLSCEHPPDESHVWEGVQPELGVMAFLAITSQDCFKDLHVHSGLLLALAAFPKGMPIPEQTNSPPQSLMPQSVPVSG